MNGVDALLDATSPAAAIAEAVRVGRATAVGVAEATLRRIEARDETYNAFTHVTAERALAEARAVDAARRAGRDPGPLAGVPYAVKNLVDIEGLPTLAGSKINAERPPAAKDGAVVTRLKAAGALLFGALNMGEYAYDFTGENVHAGPSRNPLDPARMCGGSSGGSGAAVAGGLVPLSIGSDTNGSIRVPASLCGVFGMKPTYGRISRAGSFMFVASLDHLGPLARSVRDLALAYDALQGPDRNDPVSVERAREPVAADLETSIGALRVAVAGGYFATGGTKQAFGAVAAVAQALGTKEMVQLPEPHRARAAAFVMTAAEGGNLHLTRLRARAADFDPATRDRLLAGAMVPASWYLSAQRFRRWYRDRMRAVFAQTDIVLAPATPISAPRIGQETMTIDGVETLVRPNLGIFTQPISFVGLPVVSVPVRSAGEMPIGVQIIAAPWREADALRVAYALEQAGVVASPPIAG